MANTAGGGPSMELSDSIKVVRVCRILSVYSEGGKQQHIFNLFLCIFGVSASLIHPFFVHDLPLPNRHTFLPQMHKRKSHSGSSFQADNAESGGCGGT